MLKKLILSLCLSSMVCLSLYSETSVFDFTYADGDVMPYGTSRTETFDVAMRIDNPALAGFKVTSVKIFLNVSEGLKSSTIWMSKDLNLEKKVNAPDLWSVPVDVVKGMYVDPVGGFEHTVGVLEYDLETPYLLTDSPVYVGYSIDVANTDTESLKFPILLSKVQNENGFFFHSNKTAIHWTDCSEKAGGVAVICLTLEKESSDASLGIKRVVPAYASENEGFSVDVEVTNTGSAPVTSMAYRYVTDYGSDVKEGHWEAADPIVPNLVRPSTISLSIDRVSGLGVHEIPIEIIEVNGLPNTSPAKAGKLDLTVIPFVPKRRLLIEEYTGLWCKFCIRGYIGMELIHEMYTDDQVSVCYHNNDPMMVTTEYPIDIEGYPVASIDRDLVLDPYYGTYRDVDFGIRKNVDSAISDLALADIDLRAAIDGKRIDVEASVRFIKDIDDADYMVGYVLTCDGLSDPAWLQNNAYAGASGLEGTYLEQAAAWPAYVPGLVFNDVAVEVTGMMGVEGSLPKDIHMGEPYSHSYFFNVEYSKLVTSTEDLNVVAFVVDRKSGEIVNANKLSLGEADIEGIPASSEVVATDYYDMMGRKVLAPGNGVFVRVDRLSDGRTVSTKLRR